DLPGRIMGAMGNLGSLLWDSGRALMSGFINGLYSMLQDAYNAAADILNRIRSLFPFSPAKEGPFSGRGWVEHSGQSIAEGFARGMTSGRGVVATAAADIVGAAALPGVVPAAGRTPVPAAAVAALSGEEQGSGLHIN